MNFMRLTRFRIFSLISGIAILAAICMTASSYARCPDITLNYNNNLRETVQIFEKNVDLIPPSSSRFFEKKVRIETNHKFTKWLCEIRVDYAGGGGFLWFVQDRGKRKISVRLDGKTSGTLISIKDCISKNALHTNRVGATFADNMIPFVLTNYSGVVELKYNNGSLYSKGAVIKGKREGEWTWWHPNGELLQTANYRGGKYEGKRIIRDRKDNQYAVWTLHYHNGEIQENKK